MRVRYDRVRPIMYMEVNENNPSFNYLTGLEHKFIQVKALIKNEKSEWIEKIKVSSINEAEQQVKEVIKFYNDTIVEPNDLEREFIKLCLEDEEQVKYEDGEGFTGWLTPEGEFLPCKFGEHWKVANELTKSNKEDIRQQIEKNQYISMYNGEYGGKSEYVTILGELTEHQIKWFKRFADKFTLRQKLCIETAFKEQGLGKLVCIY